MSDKQSFGDRYRARMRRAGLLWNRVVGTFLVVIGGWALLLSLGSETFSLATHWPTFVAVAGLGWLARWFFVAREIVIEPVDGDGHPGKNTYPLEGLDRRLGTLLARVAGTIALIGGIGAGWSVLTLEDFTLAGHWPVLAMSAVLLIVARMCFTARPSFLDMMSDTPLSPAEAAARRRDVAVDDQRGGEHQRRHRDQGTEIGQQAALPHIDQHAAEA